MDKQQNIYDELKNVSEEDIDIALKRLIDKGFVSYKIYESGEKYYFVTDNGKKVVEEYKKTLE